jgi:hypothetical protein
LRKDSREEEGEIKYFDAEGVEEGEGEFLDDGGEGEEGEEGGGRYFSYHRWGLAARDTEDVSLTCLLRNHTHCRTCAFSLYIPFFLFIIYIDKSSLHFVCVVKARKVLSPLEACVIVCSLCVPSPTQLLLYR